VLVAWLYIAWVLLRIMVTAGHCHGPVPHTVKTLLFRKCAGLEIGVPPMAVWSMTPKLCRGRRRLHCSGILHITSTNLLSPPAQVGSRHLALGARQHESGEPNKEETSRCSSMESRRIQCVCAIVVHVLRRHLTCAIQDHCVLHREQSALPQQCLLGGLERRAEPSWYRTGL